LLDMPPRHLSTRPPPAAWSPPWNTPGPPSAATTPTSPRSSLWSPPAATPGAGGSTWATSPPGAGKSETRPPTGLRSWSALVLWRRTELASPAGPGRSRNALACSCACGRRIRVARSVLELAPIVCAGCAQPFQPEDDEER
jgi:hypothetical protein